MKLRTGLVAVAAGLALLSGCTSTTDKDKPGGTAASPSAAPAAAVDADALAKLTAAAKKTLSGNYRVSVTMKSAAASTTIDGKVDPLAKAIEMVIDTQGQKTTVRLIGTDMYMSGLSVMQGKWVHADMSKMPGVGNVMDSFGQAFALMSGFVELKEGPPGTFTGFTDPKAALDKATSATDKDALAKIIAAGNGQKVPFSAKVADGYLVETTSSYKIEANGTAQETTVVSKMSDFGTVGAITAPDKKDVIDSPVS